MGALVDFVLLYNLTYLNACLLFSYPWFSSNLFLISNWWSLYTLRKAYIDDERVGVYSLIYGLIVLVNSGAVLLLANGSLLPQYALSYGLDDSIPLKITLYALLLILVYFNALRLVQSDWFSFSVDSTTEKVDFYHNPITETVPITHPDAPDESELDFC